MSNGQMDPKLLAELLDVIETHAPRLRAAGVARISTDGSGVLHVDLARTEPPKLGERPAKVLTVEERERLAKKRIAYEESLLFASVEGFPDPLEMPADDGSGS